MGVKQLVKNYLHIVAAQVLSSIVGLFILKTSLRHVSTSDYGNIILILTVSNTVQIFINWTCTALVRFGVEEFIANNSIKYTFWARSYIYFLNVLLIVLFSPLWFQLFHSFLEMHEFAKPLILGNIIIASLWIHGQQSLQAIRKPQIQSYLLLAERVMTLAGLFIVIIIYKLKWEHIFWMLLMSSAFMVVISFIVVRKYVTFVPVKNTKQSTKKVMAFSSPLFPFALVSFFCTNYLNAYFINAYLTKSDLTVFNTIFQITGLLTQLPILFNTLIMPQLISMRLEGKDQGIKIYMESILPLLTLLWGVVIGVASMILVWFIPKFLGHEFNGLSQVIVLLSAGALFSFPSLIGYSPYVLSVSDVRASFPMVLVTALINILGNFALIRQFELTGSSIASILSAIAGFSFIAVYVNRKYRFKSRQIFLSLLPAVLSLVLYLLIQNISLYMFCLFATSVMVIVFIRKQIQPYFSFFLSMWKKPQ